MDAQRFDALARSLATTRSRRTVLRGLVGGALGALFVGVWHDRQEVTAAPPCLGQTCVDAAGCCGGTVCDLTPGSPTLGTCQPAHGPCAATGTCASDADCCATEVCQAGVCVPTHGGCVLGGACPAGDADCCGGEVCANGVCVAASRQAGCPSGQIRCSGTCLDPSSDPANCGACGAACGASQTCCGGTCVDLQTDVNNCGGCGTTCAGTPCMGGRCSYVGLLTPEFCTLGSQCTTDENCCGGLRCCYGAQGYSACSATCP